MTVSIWPNFNSSLTYVLLISIVKEKAEEQGLLSVMFTFDRIPLSICPQKNQHFLSTNSERRMLCENYGIDVEVEYPFTTTLMNMEPEEFVSDILINKLKAKVIVVGTDYCFILKLLFLYNNGFIAIFSCITYKKFHIAASIPAKAIISSNDNK